MRPDDGEGLFYSSWIESYRQSPKTQPCPNGPYYKGQHVIIEKSLEHSEVLCAVNPEDPAQIFGWICFERQGGVVIVHYAFVKSTHRRLGICTALVQALQAEPPIHYSHWTHCAPYISDRIGAVYNPYLARHE